MALKSILLDTNAYTAFLLGRDVAREIVRRADVLALSAVVLGELLAGFAAGSRQAQNRATLTKFLASPRVRVLAISDTTADYYARTYAALRRKGRPIPTNDLWIAASALECGMRLYSYDAHFAEIDGLICGNSPEAFLL
ncbi:MAG: type II toxin-antitoxin system VapC family toxin [Nevskiales bacterium]